MGRMIDADEVIKKLNEMVADNEWLLNQFNADFIENFIDEQPTAYDVDKVVEQIKGARDEDGCIVYVDDEPAIQKNIVIQIVKAGSKE